MRLLVVFLALMPAEFLYAESVKRDQLQQKEVQGCIVESFVLHSKLMDRAIPVTVVLPPAYDPEQVYPILYTLHGRAAPHDSYANMPALRSFLSKKPLIVAMFQAGVSSYYLDASQDVAKEVIYKKPKMPKNKKISEEEFAQKTAKFDAIPDYLPSIYRSFFFDEYIPFLDKHYAVNTKKRGISGFSMGGFGAMYYLLENPKMFTACSGMSSAVFDRTAIIEREQRGKNSYAKIIGSYTDDNKAYERVFLFDRFRTLSEEAAVIPPIFQSCGDKDFLFELNNSFAEHMKKLGFQFRYIVHPGGHDWPYWSQNVAEILEFHWQYF